MTEFATEMSTFCNEIVDIINIDDTIQDEDTIIAKLLQIGKNNETSTGSSQAAMIFKKSVILIGTPGSFSTLMSKNKFKTAIQLAYHSVFLDKVDLIQAMDFKEEVVEVANVLK